MIGLPFLVVDYGGAGVIGAAHFVNPNSNRMASCFLIFWVFLVGTLLPLHAQQYPRRMPQDSLLRTIAGELQAAGFIAEKSYRNILATIERGEIWNRVDLLEQSRTEEWSRIREGIEEESGERLSNAEWIVISDSIETDTLHASAVKLKEIGAIDERVYGDIQEAITTERIRSHLDILRHSVTQLRLYEWLRPEQVRPLLNQLLANDIISDTAQSRLLDDLQQRKIDNPIEFFRYLNRALLVDLRDYSSKPEEYFPLIHHCIAEMLTAQGVASIRLDDFSLNIERNEELSSPPTLDRSLPEYVAYRVIVKARVGDIWYEHPSLHAPLPTSYGDTYYGCIDESGFINFFNKILRDQGSRYRLYSSETNSYNNLVSVPSWSRFGVIALTPSQAEVIYTQPIYASGVFRRYISLHHQDIDSSMTTGRVNDLVALYERIGLLAHLSPQQLEKGRQKVRRQYFTKPFEILAAFDSVIMSVEWEGIGSDTPYKWLLLDLATISHGGFSPTDILDQFSFEKQRAGIAFTLEGKRYTTTLEYHNSWLDGKFLLFIEKIGSEAIPAGAFYNLTPGDDFTTYIFLTDTQRDILQSEGVLPAEKK